MPERHSPEPPLRLALLSLHSCPRGKPGTRDTGGMQVYVMELARALARRGHVVDIFTRTHPGRHAQVSQCGPLVRLVHVTDGGGETSKVQLYAHLGRFQEGVECFRQSAGVDYDVIHSHYWLSGLAGLTLSRNWQAPHLVTFHTLGAAKDRSGAGPPESPLRLQSECRVAWACTRIIASTPREQLELAANCQPHPAPVAVVPCGCNLRLFKPLDRNLARTRLGLNVRRLVLAVGRLDHVKGYDLLLKSFALLPGKSTRLLVVGGDSGDQADRQRLEKLAEELGIGGRVAFHEAVSQPRLKLYYSAADACVISSRYETFSMVALEALACGTPVAATDVGGIRPLLRDPAAGMIAAEMTPASLAEALKATLAQNSGTGSRKLRRGLVKEYAWDRVAARMVTEYHAALEARPGRRRRQGGCQS
jgi:D-inositol-3-phosphate glycosyltransferase